MGNITRMDTRVSSEVYRKTSYIRRWFALVVGTDNPLRVNPLFVLLVFGLAGILLDLDHLVIQQLQMVRPFHLPYWFGSWIVCVGVCTYYYRRVHKISIGDE